MTDQQAKRVIVVLGAGRTGTSLLMNVLNAIGMTVSDIMTSPSEQNPDGGFEDSDIFALHSKILSALNTNQLFPLPEGWRNHPELSPIRNQLKDVVTKRVMESPSVFGFKDPRTAMFLPLWKQIFNQQKIVPIYLLSVRDPSSSVRSLVTQYNQGEMISELFWMHKYCDALTHTGSNCFIVHYEDWFTRPIEQAEGLLKYTGLDQFFSDNIEQALKDVIKPNLNRAVHEDYQVQNEYVQRLYDVLKDCRGNDFDRQKLMSVVKECRKAMDGFKGWYMEAQKHIAQQNQMREKLEKERVRKQELQFKLENEREQVQKKQAQVDKVQEKIDRISEMEQDLRDISLHNNEYLKELKDLHDEKEEIRVRLSSTQKELAQAKAKITALENERDRVQKKLAQVDKVQEKNDRVSEMEQDLHDEKKEMHVRLNTTQKELAKVKAKITATERKLSEQKKTQSPQKQKHPQVSQLEAKAEKWKREASDLRSSASFRLGQVLVNAISRPGKNTLFMPFKFLKIIFELIAARKKSPEAGH
jgi:hypothetical protein